MLEGRSLSTKPKNYADILEEMLMIVKEPQIVGHYSIALGEELGSGAYGVVKLATHLLTKQQVAVKIMERSYAAIVIREVEAWRHLRHQHIAQLYEIIVTESKIYLVMEFAKTGELFDYMVQRNQLQEKEARKIFTQLALTVGFCHSRGFVHRDLKPENLLLDGNFSLKLVDFGFTRRYDPNKLIKSFCGSAAYAAPEVLRMELYSGPECDVWSMGVILFAILANRLPFGDPQGDEKAMIERICRLDYVMDDCIPSQAQDLIRRILVLDPKQRMTIPEILNHDWIRGCDSLSSDQSTASGCDSQPPSTPTAFLNTSHTATCSCCGPEASTKAMDYTQSDFDNVGQTAEDKRIISNLVSLGVDQQALLNSLQDHIPDSISATFFLMRKKCLMDNNRASRERSSSFHAMPVPEDFNTRSSCPQPLSGEIRRPRPVPVVAAYPLINEHESSGRPLSNIAQKPASPLMRSLDHLAGVNDSFRAPSPNLASSLPSISTIGQVFQRNQTRRSPTRQHHKNLMGIAEETEEATEKMVSPVVSKTAKSLSPPPAPIHLQIQQPPRVTELEEFPALLSRSSSAVVVKRAVGVPAAFDQSPALQNTTNSTNESDFSSGNSSGNSTAGNDDRAHSSSVSLDSYVNPRQHRRSNGSARAFGDAYLNLVASRHAAEAASVQSTTQSQSETATIMCDTEQPADAKTTIVEEISSEQLALRSESPLAGLDVSRMTPSMIAMAAARAVSPAIPPELLAAGEEMKLRDPTPRARDDSAVVNLHLTSISLDTGIVLQEMVKPAVMQSVSSDASMTASTVESSLLSSGTAGSLTNVGTPSAENSPLTNDYPTIGEASDPIVIQMARQSNNNKSSGNTEDDVAVPSFMLSTASSPMFRRASLVPSTSTTTATVLSSSLSAPSGFDTMNNLGPRYPTTLRNHRRASNGSVALPPAHSGIYTALVASSDQRRTTPPIAVHPSSFVMMESNINGNNNSGLQIPGRSDISGSSPSDSGVSPDAVGVAAFVASGANVRFSASSGDAMFQFEMGEQSYVDGNNDDDNLLAAESCGPDLSDDESDQHHDTSSSEFAQIRETYRRLRASKAAKEALTRNSGNVTANGNVTSLPSSAASPNSRPNSMSTRSPTPAANAVDSPWPNEPSPSAAVEEPSADSKVYAHRRSAFAVLIPTSILQMAENLSLLSSRRFSLDNTHSGKDGASSGGTVAQDKGSEGVQMSSRKGSNSAGNSPSPQRKATTRANNDSAIKMLQNIAAQTQYQASPLSSPYAPPSDDQLEEETSSLRKVRDGIFGVPTTSTKEATFIIQDLLRVLVVFRIPFERMEEYRVLVDCAHPRPTIPAEYQSIVGLNPSISQSPLTKQLENFSTFRQIKFEIEVCSLAGDMRGVRCRRLQGDTWVYKTLCKGIVEELRL